MLKSKLRYSIRLGMPACRTNDYRQISAQFSLSTLLKNYWTAQTLVKTGSVVVEIFGDIGQFSVGNFATKLVAMATSLYVRVLYLHVMHIDMLRIST